MKSYSQRSWGQHDKTAVQFVKVLSKDLRDEVSFSFWLDPSQAYQNNTGVEQLLTEDEISKVLVCSQRDYVTLAAPYEHSFIIDARIQLSYVMDIVPVGSEAFNDMPVDAFVGDDIRLAVSKG
jgi:hypothetical protein